MKYFIGIDLGTSSVKVILLDSNGQVVSSVTKDYPLYFPNDGWSEQSPEDWYNETISALSELLEDKNLDEICDCLEVLFAIGKKYGYSEKDLVDRRNEKKNSRGGFEKNIVLKKTYKKKAMLANLVINDII